MKLALFTLVALALLALVAAQAPPIVDNESFKDSKCKPGQCFADGIWKPRCMDCAPGTYENGWGTKCSDKHGGVSWKGNTHYLCLKHVADGFWSPPGSDKPLPCPAGTITFRDYGADYNLGTSCKKCPFGTYAPKPGTPACLPCPKGQYQDESGQAKCKKCPLNSKPSADKGQCVFESGSSPTANKGLKASLLERVARANPTPIIHEADN